MESEEQLLGLIDLDEIIVGYLLQHQMPQSKYNRISSIAIRGWRLFYRDSTGAPITTTLPVQANNTAVLPAGALNKISCGVLNNRGEIASLTYDPLLGLNNSTNPKRLSQPTEELMINNEDLIFSLQDSQNIGYIGYYGFAQFGIGSQPVVGFYNIDWANRVMVFNFGQLQFSSVEFTYLGLPDCDGTYLIHPFFQEALIAYINWQDSVGNPRKSKGERQLNEHDFNVQYKNARKAMAPFDPSDIYNNVRQSTRLSPKS